MDTTPSEPTLSDADIPTLRRALTDAGYRIVTHREGWMECLIQGGDERWFGRGVDADDAMRDAIRQMVPSHLAQALLLASLAAPTRQDGEASPTTPAPRARAGSRTSSASQPTEPPFPRAQVISRPSHPVEPRPRTAGARNQPGSTGPQRGAGDYVELRGSAHQRPKRVLAPTVPAVGPAVDEALDELSLLRRRVADARPEVAVMAPELQRLHFLAWICRARCVQDRVPYAMDVERAVGEIARTLGDLGKLWWPGSVKALQFKATPLDAGAELGLEGGGRLHDWLEAADRAEAILDSRLEQNGAGRYDDYGWVDRGALNPPPNKPNALLKEVTSAIERYVGTVERPVARDGPPGLRRGEETDLLKLLEWTRKLRWLRGHITHTETWAAAVGRVRWAVSRAPRDRTGQIREALDSTFCPTQAWAQVLGQNPQEKRQRRQRRDLLQDLPQEGSAETGELIDWLGGAFDLGTQLSNPRIAGLLYPLKADVLALEPTAMAEDSRRTRKRLADLKRRLQEVSQEEAAQIRRAAERELAAEPAPAPVPEPLPEPEPEEPQDPLFAVTEGVRRYTAGKKALFVSNRKDPALKVKLEDLLALELTWSVIDPRRVQAKCESITQGSFDFVLSATGFQGHNVDTALYRAARSAGVKYVRVNRGRPQTCVRALAREFGVRSA